MAQHSRLGTDDIARRVGDAVTDSDRGKCLSCDGLLRAVPLDKGLPLTTLLERSRQGCESCALVSDAVLAVNQDEEPLEDLKIGWDTMRIRGLRIVVGQAATGQFLFGIDVYAPEGHESSMPWRWATECERPTAISGNTSSAVAIDSIVGWMENCSQHHACKEAAAVPLPTRLIDVATPERVFLYCPEPGETGTYACLSHCWGTSHTLQTTMTSFERHRDAIPWDDLPNVFKDVIRVLRKLGIRYLWVDSLCIVQDSEPDWRRESASMADVYAHSAVTIAASLASGDSERLFATAPEAHVSRRLRSQDGNDRGVLVRKTLAHGHGAQPLPLMSRAWALQERLLSPRVVHFTPEELVWECMEALRCECGCIRSLWSPGHVPFDKDLLSARVLRGAPSRAAVRERWRRLVEEYSRLQLTLDRDRLPAVGGAARRVKDSVGGGRYLAGLWREGLIGDLLWERRGKVGRRLDGMPSWSWAALATQVAYDEAMATEELGVVLEAGCDLVREDDEFGEVRGGAVCLSAVAGSISLRRRSEGDSLLAWCLQSEDDGGWRSCDDGDIVLDDDDNNALLHGKATLTCVKMALRRGVYRTGSDQGVWLVLSAVDEGRRVFRRVGLLRTSVGDVDDLEGQQPEAVVVTIV